MDAITYALSKKYTDSKVSQSTGLHREIVNSLPATGDNNTIYMVLDPNASSPDIYDEWLWVNGAYEHIGSTRVDLTDYYNKTQVDTALNGKANTATTLAGYGITDAYTKTETDTALSGKASTSDIPTTLASLSDDTTHRLVSDTEKNTWNGKANTSDIPTALSGLSDDSTHRLVTDTEKSTWSDKADISDIPTKLSDFTNDSGFVTSTVNNLTNYYLKSETYTKAEVGALIQAITTLDIQAVSTLPTTDISTTTIYLVPKQDAQSPDVKDEYINLDGTTTGWELIGSTQIDLSNYVTTSDLNTALSTKQDSLTFDNVPTQNSNNPVKSGGIFSTVDDVYSVMGQMGAKNLINYPYYDPSGRTNRGITFTYDEDGIITANGSTNANDQAFINLDNFDRGLVLSSTKKYTLTCEKTNDNNKGFAVLYFKNADNTAKTVSTHVVYEDGTTQNVNRDYVSLLYNNVAHTSATFWVDTDTIYITQARIHTNSGTITNAVLKPMLRLASDTDNTYQPYAKTNKQLTNDKAEVVSVRNYVNELGVKNLLVPKWAETLTTENGVTYTFNADGTIVMNTDASGATANTNCNLRDRSITTNNLFPAGSYILTGCPTGGELNKYRTWVRAYRPNTNTALTENLYDEGNGVSFTVSEPFSLGINATVFKDYVCNNLTWKPMLRLASDINDDTYVPFAKTNKELTNGIDDVYKTMGELGAKNLIPYPYGNTTKTVNGITFTDNGDGSITVDGTATGKANFWCIRWEDDFIFPEGKYILSAGGAGNDNVSLFLANYNNSMWKRQYVITDGGEVAVTVQHSGDYNRTPIGISVKSGTTVDNITFYPMLRFASDTDNTYQPYAKTNRQLTEDKVELETIRDYVNELGVKNLIPYPYYEKTNTADGITWTDNGDGTVTANGTATQTTYFTLSTRTGDTNMADSLVEGERYILTGCPTGGSNQKYDIFINETYNGAEVGMAFDYGNGATFTLNHKTENNYGLGLRIRSGQTVSNLTFKPMLRLAADINDDTYVPFAMTNKQLTERKADISDVPTALSQLSADATHRTVTDTEKTTWNGKANTSDIPTKLSQLSGDSTHRVVTDTEKTTWNGKSNFSGSYNDLSNKPTIPTTLSQLSEDATHRLVTDTEKSTWNNSSDPIKTQSLTINVPAVSAGRGTVVYKALPTVSGYKAIGIIDISPIGEAGNLSLNSFFVNKKEAYISYENNRSSGTAAASVNLTILYKKT